MRWPFLGDWRRDEKAFGTADRRRFAQIFLGRVEERTGLTGFAGFQDFAKDDGNAFAV
jgi:hypothetical protein